jgi:hypothetical protein
VLARNFSCNNYWPRLVQEEEEEISCIMHGAEGVSISILNFCKEQLVSSLFERGGPEQITLRLSCLSVCSLPKKRLCHDIYNKVKLLCNSQHP